jgi:hypothetical protein
MLLGIVFALLALLLGALGIVALRAKSGLSVTVGVLLLLIAGAAAVVAILWFGISMSGGLHFGPLGQQ